MSETSSSTDSPSAFASRFLSTHISDSAPAALKRLIVSYSQFVPGNTGITTLGRANFSFATTAERSAQVNFSTFSGLISGTTVGNTFSSVDSQSFWRASTSTDSPPSVNLPSSVVMPRSLPSILSSVSTMNAPYPSPNSDLLSISSAALKPIRFPSAILTSPSAAPPISTA